MICAPSGNASYAIMLSDNSLHMSSRNKAHGLPHREQYGLNTGDIRS